MEGGSGLARHWFRGRFQASALPLVKLWAVLRSAELFEGPGSLGEQGPAANDVSSVARKENLCAAQLGIQKAFSHTLPRGKLQPRFRREQRAGWADAPLPGPAAQGAPILPGGQWRPGLRREQRAGRADTPAGRLSPCTGVRGAPRPLFVTFSRQRK